MRKQPDFFIVGAPKCGTTALADYLQTHPEVFMARKEMHFFGRDLEFRPRFYRRDRQEYLDEFRGWDGQRRGGEASVWYLFSRSAAQEIKAFNPAARIVIMLRAPAEMLHSLYHQFRYDGNEHLATFEEALSAEEDRRARRRVARRAYFAPGLLYRNVARYTEQVRRYFDAFGRKRVHVILYDDFASDTRAEYRRTLEFLEVNSDAAGCEFKVVNPNKCARSPFLQAMVSEPLVRSAAIATRRWLPVSVFALLQRMEARCWRANTRFQRRLPLSPGVAAELTREFASEVEQLSDLLQRDLSHWNREPTKSAERVLRAGRVSHEHAVLPT